MTTPLPIDDYEEEMGQMLFFEEGEGPLVHYGSPLDLDFPWDYETPGIWFIPLPRIQKEK